MTVCFSCSGGGAIGKLAGVVFTNFPRFSTTTPFLSRVGEPRSRLCLGASLDISADCFSFSATKSSSLPPFLSFFLDLNKPLRRPDFFSFFFLSSFDGSCGAVDLLIESKLLERVFSSEFELILLPSSRSMFGVRVILRGSALSSSRNESRSRAVVLRDLRGAASV